MYYYLKVYDNDSSHLTYFGVTFVYLVDIFNLLQTYAQVTNIANIPTKIILIRAS